MKILYVVARPLEINTSSSIRNKATIQGLQEIGHEVQMMTTEPDKNHPAYDSSMAIEGIQTYYIQQGKVETIAKLGRKLRFLQPLKNVAYKILMSNSIYDNLVSATNYINDFKTDLSDMDYIISSSDPKSSHLLAQRLIELHPEFTGKWIQIWGDPFFGDISFDNKQYKRIIKEEHRLISLADKVVYVSPLTLFKQQNLYPDCAKKMVFQPIPYVEVRLSSPRDLNQVKPIEIAYCGDYISSVRNILPLYECIKLSTSYHLTICGTTDLQLKQTPSVSIYPRVNRKMVADIEEKADILVHLSNLKGTQIPGKIYQYAGTNKPILFILDGEKDKLVELFEKYHRFYFSENNFEEIKGCLSSIICDKELSAKSIPLADFSPQKIAARLVD